MSGVLDVRPAPRGGPARYIHTDDAAQCPCCGAPVEENRIIVSLDTNQICVGGRQGSVKLSPQQTEIAYALAKAYPRPLTLERIIQSVWGGRECDVPEKAVEVQIYNLRRKITPLGLTIENSWKRYRFHAAEYRLVDQLRSA